ncbi:MAG: hypothetical protein V3W34_13005 [Phycisphaerae bacterium]
MRFTGLRRSAVTLLEIVLAIGLIVPVLGMMFWFYASTLAMRDASAEHIRRNQLARVVADRIAREIRQSTGFSGGYGPGIYGTRERVSINTVVIPDKALVEHQGIRRRRAPGQFDLRQIDYYIAWDDVNTDENGDPRALGLVRRERKTFNRLSPTEAEAIGGVESEGEESATDTSQEAAGPARSLFGRSADEVFDDDLGEELDDEEREGAKHELYAPEIKFIEFFYHDGSRWWDSWEITQGNALPQMVMITVGYEPELPEDENIEIIEDILEDEDDIEPLPADRYLTVVRVPQADSLFLGPRIQREMLSYEGLEDAE